MTFRQNRILTNTLAVVLTIGAFSFVQAQRWGDFDGQPSIFNPNSGHDFADFGPRFTYFAETGVFTIFNAGENGIVDSPDNVTLLGDDYGMASVLITLDAIPGSDVSTLLPVFEDGVLWNTFAYFNGKLQLSGSFTPDGAFLPISEDEVPLAQLPVGLDADDFRNSDGQIQIETAVNFAPGLQGDTLFSLGDPLATGAFRIVPVPEPSSIAMLATALLGMIGLRRRNG